MLFDRIRLNMLVTGVGACSEGGGRGGRRLNEISELVEETWEMSLVVAVGMIGGLITAMSTETP